MKVSVLIVGQSKKKWAELPHVEKVTFGSLKQPHLKPALPSGSDVFVITLCFEIRVLAQVLFELWNVTGRFKFARSDNHAFQIAREYSK